MSTRTLLYEKGVDATPGCYITNYVNAGVGLLLGIFLLYRAKPLSFDIRKRTYSLSLFFIMNGLGLGLCGGIVHQYYPHDDTHEGTPMGYYVFWSATLIIKLRLLQTFHAGIFNRAISIVIK